MTKTREGRSFFRSAARAAAGAIALLVVGLLAPPAQAATDCAEITDPAQRLACKSDRLKAKFDRAADETRKAAETLGGAEFQGYTTEEQRASLKSSSARLERERRRVDATELTAQAGKRKMDCPLKECDPDLDPRCLLPVDGDGICDPDENCWETLGDGAGDDLQPCDRTLTGRDRELCTQVCDARTAETQQNVDEEALDEVESTYDDVGNLTQEINEALPAVRGTITALAALEGSDPCAEGAAAGRWSQVGRVHARASTAFLRGAADTLERFCDQEALGTNTAVACYVAEIAASVAANLLNVLEISEGNIDSAVMDASLACARQARDKGAGMAEKLGAAKKKLEAIEANQATIIQLIETAQGRRPGFPNQ